MLIFVYEFAHVKLLPHACNNVKVELMCVIHNPAKSSKEDPWNII